MSIDDVVAYAFCGLLVIASLLALVLIGLLVAAL